MTCLAYPKNFSPCSESRIPLFVRTNQQIDISSSKSLMALDKDGCEINKALAAELKDPDSTIWIT